MIDYPHFILAFTLYTVAMLATPGPNNAAMMAVGISRGYRATLPHLSACVIFGTLMLLVTGAGLGEVFKKFPLLYRALQIAGALYMIWLAGRIAGIDVVARLKALYRRCRGRAEDGKNAKRSSGAIQPMTFFQATLFQLVNVKAWMSCVVAVSAYAGADEHTWTRLWIMAAIYTVIGIPSGLLWGVGGEFMGKFMSSEGMRRANYVFASFLLVSVLLIFL